jgi:hypothetical protein
MGSLCAAVVASGAAESPVTGDIKDPPQTGIRPGFSAGIVGVAIRTTGGKRRFLR